MKNLIYFLLLLPHCLFAQTFNEIIKAVAEDRSASDRFGYAVDISDNYAVVGAYADDFSDVDPNMGSAYIFEKEGVGDWTFVQKIFNSDQDDYDRFGWSVAIDGDYIVVGAYAEDHNEVDAENLSSAGSAYIYERDGSGVWTETQKIVASDREVDDEFGWSVDISGTTLIVGAHFESHDVDGLAYIYHTGSAYIFERDVDGFWTETQKIVGSGRAPDITFPDGGGGEDLSDQFGGSVSISGDRIIVGAHHHDYNEVGGAPLSEAGTAYIFERIAGVWTETARLVNSDRETGDRFGYDVAVENDFAIVSAYSEDEDVEGGSSFPNSGSAYFFIRNLDGSWTEVQKLVAEDRSIGDRFGWSIALSSNFLVIGAKESSTDENSEFPLIDAGAAYVFEYDSDLLVWNQINKLDASDRQIDDNLGAAVGISGPGIIVGAFQQDFDAEGGALLGDAGAAYFYTNEVCTPSSSSQTLTLCAGASVEVGPYSHEETGVYTDVLLSTSGCDSTVTTDLTILPAPTFSQSAEICFGYSFYVGGIEHTSTGFYTDTLTAGDGCDSIVFTDLNVTPENAITQEITICWGESYSIGGSTYDEPGTYEDVLTSWALCDCTITTILAIQLPVDKSVSQSLSLLTANADDASYQWVKCDPFEIIPGATDQVYVAPVIGKYAVIVTEDYCSDTSACIFVDVLGTREENSKNGLTIYPNPNNGYFHLDGNMVDYYHTDWQIQSILGEDIISFSIESLPFSLSFNNLVPGIYVLKGTTASGETQSYQIVIR